MCVTYYEEKYIFCYFARQLLLVAVVLGGDNIGNPAGAVGRGESLDGTVFIVISQTTTATDFYSQSGELESARLGAAQYGGVVLFLFYRDRIDGR